MQTPRFQFIGRLLGLLITACPLMAEISPAPPFRDHAILQRNLPLPVWGRAEPGERILVTFRDQQVGTTTDRDGRWIVCLEPLSASLEPADLVIAGNTTVTVRDVLVGEVWLASGQSNMARRINSLPDAGTVAGTIRNDYIRHLNVEPTPATAPADTVTTSGWLPASPVSAGEFSAVAWFFSAELHRKLGVPVGIINASWGSTTIEAWTDARTLRANPAWPAIGARWQHLVANLPAIQADYAAWEQRAKAAQSKGEKIPLPRPLLPFAPGTQQALSESFNGMIAPLQPYALRGVIWYQGESNVARHAEYPDLFRDLIRAWRAQWGQDRLPFLFVQLPNYNDPYDVSGQAWPWLREAQARALELPDTAMAVTIDCGDPQDIHPQNKPIVGRRLARLATVKLYDLPGDWSGPQFVAATREGRAMRVTFDHVDTGLTAERLPPQALELAGEDRQFHPATAVIERNTLLVSSPQVAAPVAVRYAWSNAPVANLFNGAGLPAAPFRSDDW